METYGWKDEIVMSILPASHVAALMIDCYMVMENGSTTHFADRMALKGTLARTIEKTGLNEHLQL